MTWLDLPTSLTLPAGIVDPHIHLWDPLTTERVVSKEARVLRFLPRVPRAVRWALPQADREFAGNPHHLLKPYLPADHRADSLPVDVSTIVHIEAAWPHPTHRDTVGETRWLAGLLPKLSDHPCPGDSSQYNHLLFAMSRSSRSSTCTTTVRFFAR